MFPSPGSGDLWKASEEKGVEPSGLESKCKALWGLRGADEGEIGRGCYSIPTIDHKNEQLPVRCKNCNFGNGAFGGSTITLNGH